MKEKLLIIFPYPFICIIVSIIIIKSIIIVIILVFLPCFSFTYKYIFNIKCIIHKIIITINGDTIFFSPQKKINKLIFLLLSSDYYFFIYAIFFRYLYIIVKTKLKI